MNTYLTHTHCCIGVHAPLASLVRACERRGRGVDLEIRESVWQVINSQVYERDRPQTLIGTGTSSVYPATWSWDSAAEIALMQPTITA